MEYNDFLCFLLERFKIERKKFDRSGVYLPRSDDYYRSKDVEEMNGHFNID